MKRAVSVSLGSSKRDKKVVVELNGQKIEIERRGTNGDKHQAKALFEELDGQVDCLSVGGVDLHLPLEERKYPLHSALWLVENVKNTPVVDGGGLKETLERRVWELAEPELGEIPHFKSAFVPMAIDRPGLTMSAEEVSDEIIIGDLMVALGIPISIRGFDKFKIVARFLLPFVSHFPMSMLFYGSSGKERDPKYQRFWRQADLIAGDFLFMRKHVIDDLEGKTVITNTTTEPNIEFLKERGVKKVITTTPRFDGRSFGTNMNEAMLTAYAGLGRTLTAEELNALIDELNIRPTVIKF